MQDRLAQLVIHDVGAGAVLARIVRLDLGDVGHDPILEVPARPRARSARRKICIQIVVRCAQPVYDVNRI